MINQYPHHKEPTAALTDSPLRTGAHTTYNINYHLVWIPKYRRSALRDMHLKRILEDIVRGQCQDRDWVLKAFEIQPDHIHAFLSVPPSTSVSNVMHQLKGNTSRQLRRIFPNLKKEVSYHSLWADGYYCSTAGYISEDKVKRYIEDQKHHIAQQQRYLDAKRKVRTLRDYFRTPPPLPLVDESTSFRGSC